MKTEYDQDQGPALVESDEEAAALSAAAPGFAFAGDCTSVKNIMNATRTGWQAGLNIGR